MTALTDEEPTQITEAPNPYKGLRAFDEADAGDFFGRSTVIADILERLAADDVRGRLVLVVGGSGTGKSSTVRAGPAPLGPRAATSMGRTAGSSPRCFRGPHPSRSWRRLSGAWPCTTGPASPTISARTEASTASSVSSFPMVSSCSS